MSDGGNSDKAKGADQGTGKDAGKASGSFLGSLRDALAAAGRDEDTRVVVPGGSAANQMPQTTNSLDKSEETLAMSSSADDNSADQPPPLPSAAEAAREARGGTPNIPPVADPKGIGGDAGGPPTTRVVREGAAPAAHEPRTQLVRGRQPVQRGEFAQDPVVGWLVIVGGPGMGSFRPVFEGNNTVGRSPQNRVPVDFGDDAISADEQAYIRYDSADRSFLLVPNLSKTNVVSVNDQRPTTATPLQSMDVITMGRTQLVFVPFCGTEFDWGELSNLKT